MATYDKQLHEKYRQGLLTQSLSNVLPFYVDKYGLDRNMNFWSFINENPSDKRFSMGPTANPLRKSKSWQSFASAALGELSESPYAAAPTLYTDKGGEARPRTSSRRGRRGAGAAGGPL
jgi:hypothetical protein